MSSSNRFRDEIVLLVLQFLKQENFNESAHWLEKESGVFFNLRYLKELVDDGKWDEAENYLSGFTKADDNDLSRKIFFEIKKHKYLEALDRKAKGEALEILEKDLKEFLKSDKEIFDEMTLLLPLENFRTNEKLSNYGDTSQARSVLFIDLKRLIEVNPQFKDKLVFPTQQTSRLATLMNQSLKWQFRSNMTPIGETLFMDHISTTLNANPALPVLPYALLPPRPSPSTTAFNANVFGWMASSSAFKPYIHAAVAGQSLMAFPTNQGVAGYQNTRSEHLRGRLQSTAILGHEATHITPRPQVSGSLNALPRTVAWNIQQGSNVTSMDFHPTHHTLLLVGSGSGEVTLWQIGSQERLLAMPFKIWDRRIISKQFQSSFEKDLSISITKVAWSPDGKLMGVAFTKHLIQLYECRGPTDLHQYLEVEAHVGNVNDLAFCYPYEQLCVVTCGEDKLIKVWNLNGMMLLKFPGHEEPVYSVCPHQKGNIKYLISTAMDGKIKVWQYGMGFVVEFGAPGRWCTTMVSSADGKRLFSCGSSKDGECFLLEWDHSEQKIKRRYMGFQKKSAGVVQFDSAQNKFLAAGEDNRIKFWDMDNVDVLATTEADGGLPPLPRLRFNRKGNLLAVSTAENGFRILASAKGLNSLRRIQSRLSEALRSASVPKNGQASTSQGIQKPRALEDASDQPKLWDLDEDAVSVEYRVVTLPESSTDPAVKVVRLLYTNSGDGVLALWSNGIQKLWKWESNEKNPSGKATASAIPQCWQPPSGLLMTNDVADVPRIGEALSPCIALSKSDKYVISAAGGRVSLFEMMTFKVKKAFMRPPPSSTVLLFQPKKGSNIVAIGMEDSTIHIFDLRPEQVTQTLRGHQMRVTGLAFSTKLNILVSSGADAQLCIWDTTSWDMKKSDKVFQLPFGVTTRIEFHCDQILLLVFLEMQPQLQVAIYDASRMEAILQLGWHEVFPEPLSYATYSCNGQLVYACFCDGQIGIFNADTLVLRSRIAPSAYIPHAAVVTGQHNVYPVVIAAHPEKPSQLAVGFTDGSVKVIEPID